jgi:hypothetical protein
MLVHQGRETRYFLRPMALVEPFRRCDHGTMTRVATAVSSPARRVTVRVTYRASDVERAAASMDVLLGGEEIQAILAAIDSDLPTLAADATHSAVLARIFNELQTVSHAHADCDDD